MVGRLMFAPVRLDSVIRFTLHKFFRLRASLFFFPPETYGFKVR